MTREEESILLQKFIEEKGATILPPGEGSQEPVPSVWGRPRTKKAKAKKVKKPKTATKE